MERRDIISSKRLALEVKRYHTCPVTRTQTVGEHSAQVMLVYWEIFGEPSPAIWAYILLHDITEIYTGDIPFPIKTDYVKIKEGILEAEVDAARLMGLPIPNFAANAKDRLQVKLCDLLEMCKFGQEEMRMGNQYAESIFQDTLTAARKLADEMKIGNKLEEWINGLSQISSSHSLR